MEIEECKMKGRSWRGTVQTLKSGCWILPFESEKLSMHCQTLGWDDTLPDSSCVQELPRLPIMLKLVPRKARRILFISWRSF